MKKRAFKVTPISRDRLQPLIKPVIFICSGVFIVVLSGFLGRYALKNSELFSIKEIVQKDAGVVDLGYLKGKNLFSLDLKRESQNILDSYPGYSRVRLIRVFPNRIYVDLITRKPVAIVKLYKFFALDEYGIIFLPPERLEESGLPIVTGLETKIFKPQPGARYTNKEVLIVLQIIKAVKRDRFLRNYRIKRIDVAKPSIAYFLLALPTLPSDSNKIPGRALDNALEVRVGQSNIFYKVRVISQIVQGSKGNASNIAYIDLRFKEPVIKYKNAQPQ